MVEIVGECEVMAWGRVEQGGVYMDISFEGWDVDGHHNQALFVPVVFLNM
jgi:hypothetical protein